MKKLSALVMMASLAVFGLGCGDGDQQPAGNGQVPVSQDAPAGGDAGDAEQGDLYGDADEAPPIEDTGLPAIPAPADDEAEPPAELVPEADAAPADEAAPADDEAAAPPKVDEDREEEEDGQ